MEIGKDGSLNLSSVNVEQLSNEQIIWLYVSLRSAYIAKKEDWRRKMKQVSALEGMLSAMADDEEQAEMVNKIQEKIEEMKKGGEEFPEDKYMLGICSYLKPKFYLIKGADEDLVNFVVKDSFNEESKTIQKVLAETEDGE